MNNQKKLALLPANKAANVLLEKLAGIQKEIEQGKCGNWDTAVYLMTTWLTASERKLKKQHDIVFNADCKHYNYSKILDVPYCSCYQNGFDKLKCQCCQYFEEAAK